MHVGGNEEVTGLTAFDEIDPVSTVSALHNQPHQQPQQPRTRTPSPAYASQPPGTGPYAPGSAAPYGNAPGYLTGGRAVAGAQVHIARLAVGDGSDRGSEELAPAGFTRVAAIGAAARATPAIDSAFAHGAAQCQLRRRGRAASASRNGLGRRGAVERNLTTGPKIRRPRTCIRTISRAPVRTRTSPARSRPPSAPDRTSRLHTASPRTRAPRPAHRHRSRCRRPTVTRPPKSNGRVARVRRSAVRCWRPCSRWSRSSD